MSEATDALYKFIQAFQDLERKIHLMDCNHMMLIDEMTRLRKEVENLKKGSSTPMPPHDSPNAMKPKYDIEGLDKANEEVGKMMKRYKGYKD